MVSVIALVLVILPGLAYSFPQINFPPWMGRVDRVGQAQPYPRLPPYPLGGYVCCNQPPTPLPTYFRGRFLRDMAKRGVSGEAQRFPKNMQWVIPGKRLAGFAQPEPFLPNASADDYGYGSLAEALRLNTLYRKRGFVEAAGGPGGGNTRWSYGRWR